ncbi:MAG: hypothetical protein P4L34_06920 [Paludibacter sp.]|nr:hypothetical protein [Paludibacter sp.]
MEKIYILFLFLFSFILLSSATPNDSTSTIYRKGEFITYSQVRVNASDSISNVVINKFVNQMCYDLDGLYKWGLKGMHLVNEKDELLVFDFKTTIYNPRTSILRGGGDVRVTGITKIPNVYVDSKLSEIKHSNGRKDVRLDLASSNSLLKNMIGVFSYIPNEKNKSGYYTLETHIKFGWFFNIFVTQSRYKKIMEWRIKQLVHNLKEESEKRDKALRK